MGVVPWNFSEHHRDVIFEAAPFAMFSAEWAYDPLAEFKAEVNAVGRATISATTETFEQRLAMREVILWWIITIWKP